MTLAVRLERIEAGPGWRLLSLTGKTTDNGGLFF
jgi:hypothetical protein